MKTITTNSPAGPLTVVISNARVTALTEKREMERSPSREVFRPPGTPVREVFEPARILLADDEIDLWWQECLEALARSGCHVDTVEDGAAAWGALQINDYDLFITDNKMPKLWGVELIERLRTQGMALPIILASSLLPIIPTALKPYFLNVHILEKPISPSELLVLVEQGALAHHGLAGRRFATATDSRVEMSGRVPDVRLNAAQGGAQ